MFSGNTKMAMANLRAAKWRSILTMVGIVIGVVSVVLIVSLGEGLKKHTVGQINQLGSNVLTIRSGNLVNKHGNGLTGGLNLLAFFSSTLNNADIKALKKLPISQGVVPISFVSNSAAVDHKELDNIYVIGTSSDAPSVLHQKMAYGSFFSDSDNNQSVAVIGSDIARKLFNQLNPVGQSLNILGNNFVIRGVLEPSSGGLFSIAQADYNSSIFVPLDDVQDITGGRNNIMQILLKVKGGSNLDDAATATHSALLATHNNQEDFTVLKQNQVLDIANGVVNSMTGFIGGIAAISLIVGGIGIMNIMLVNVSERTREIGIRKAVGATNRQILGQFLVEGIALSLTGAIVGLLLSVAATLAINVYTSFEPSLSPIIMALALIVAVGIGVLFSAAPALKAARKDPIDALRHE